MKFDKRSRIVPIYKDSDPLLPSNYRPISILPTLSKIVESLLCDRMNHFIMKHKIIHKNQFGFQKSSGSLSAATTVVDTLQTNLDATPNNKACCVFIDLKKAFDTVPHSKLLDKLNQYGIRGNANSLLRDYLLSREQFVDIDDNHTATIINDNPFALPQGSNLGPLLFIIYINGIFDLKLNGVLILIADDAILIYFNTNLDTLRKMIQEDLAAITSWLSQNKLTLNAEKTKFMLFNCNEPDYINFNIRIGAHSIERVSHFKYLGIMLQDNLKWTAHIDSTCRKINGVSSIMSRLGSKTL